MGSKGRTAAPFAVDKQADFKKHKLTKQRIHNNDWLSGKINPKKNQADFNHNVLLTFQLFVPQAQIKANLY